MNLVVLSRLVIKAKKNTTIPDTILEVCGEYYSPYYLFMYLISKQLDGLLVELGVETGRGLTSLALSDNQVIGIDNKKKPELDGVLNRFDNIQFLEQSSLPPPDFLEPNTIALLHIDTEHSEAQAREEFEAYKPFLKKGSVVIFDDLNAKDNEVGRYFVSLPYSKIRDDDLHPSCGWGVLLYEPGFD